MKIFVTAIICIVVLLVVIANAPPASWIILPPERAVNAHALLSLCTTDPSVYITTSSLLAFSLMLALIAALATSEFCYFFAVLNTIQTKVQHSDRGIVTHSCPGVMSVSPQTCLTTSSARPSHDLPLFSLSPLSLRIPRCRGCSTSALILKYACARQMFSL
jgi:hypothetical protein